MHQPWTLDTEEWFDHPFDSHPSINHDPFTNSLFDWHWSDELLLPSLRSFKPVFEATQPKQTHLSKKVKFNFDVRDFAPQDLTLKLQGRDLVIEGEKLSCDFSSCSKRRYYMKKKLPDDVDLDTVTARLLGKGSLQIEVEKRGFQGGGERQMPLYGKGKRSEAKVKCKRRPQQRRDATRIKDCARDRHMPLQEQTKMKRGIREDGDSHVTSRKTLQQESTKFVSGENQDTNKSKEKNIYDNDEETIEVVPEDY